MSSPHHSGSHTPGNLQRGSPHNRSVRLAKLSSAQPLLMSSASKPQQKMLHRLALIIQESAATPNESTKGKLPVEAAYVVMKKITESAGAPIMPVGLSTFNKLESLRTDPAVTVLKSQTWKDFFTAQRPHSPALARSTGTGSKTVTPSAEQAEPSGPTLLDVILDTLIGRVETLWDELRIPEKERKFYRKSLCKFPAHSLEQCKELSIYIEALQEHKIATKNVLTSILVREKAVKRCYDVLLALNRKYARILSLHRDANMSTGRPSSASSTPMLGRSAKLDSLPIGSGVQTFWKEELIMALDEVRCASLDVIKAIQLWRRDLWRPHAFIYREANYLLKMATDMNVLESDTYQRLLALLPLELGHLLCVVFSREVLEAATSREVQLASQWAGIGQGEPEPQQEEDAVSAMVKEFTTNIEPNELEAAAKVILQEEALQQAVQTEQLSLVSKGVFIPLLRVKFVSNQQEDDEEMSR